MIICDIISWIWRYLIYSLILGVMGGDKLDLTLGTLASRATFLWWSTGFARILIQPKFSTRMTLVCTLDPFLSFWTFCWTLNVINRKWTGPEVDRKCTNLSRAYVLPNVFSLLFWRKWWRSFEVRHSHIGFHLDKIESIHHLDMIWKMDHLWSTGVQD